MNERIHDDVDRALAAYGGSNFSYRTFGTLTLNPRFAVVTEAVPPELEAYDLPPPVVVEPPRVAEAVDEANPADLVPPPAELRRYVASLPMRRCGPRRRRGGSGSANWRRRRRRSRSGAAGSRCRCRRNRRRCIRCRRRWWRLPIPRSRRRKSRPNRCQPRPPAGGDRAGGDRAGAATVPASSSLPELPRSPVPRQADPPRRFMPLRSPSETMRRGRAGAGRDRFAGVGRGGAAGVVRAAAHQGDADAAGAGARQVPFGAGAGKLSRRGRAAISRSRWCRSPRCRRRRSRRWTFRAPRGRRGPTYRAATRRAPTGRTIGRRPRQHPIRRRRRSPRRNPQRNPCSRTISYLGRRCPRPTCSHNGLLSAAADRSDPPQEPEPEPGPAQPPRSAEPPPEAPAAIAERVEWPAAREPDPSRNRSRGPPHSRSRPRNRQSTRRSTRLPMCRPRRRTKSHGRLHPCRWRQVAAPAPELTEPPVAGELAASVCRSRSQPPCSAMRLICSTCCLPAPCPPVLRGHNLERVRAKRDSPVCGVQGDRGSRRSRATDFRANAPSTPGDSLGQDCGNTKPPDSRVLPN